MFHAANLGLLPWKVNRAPTAGEQTARGSYGGWVNDSTPEAEFQETVNKSTAMLKAVALAEGFAR